MTVILAIEHPETGEIAIGADGLLNGWNSVITRTARKLYELAPGVIFGLAGNWRAATLIALAMRQGTIPTESPEDFACWLIRLGQGDGWTPGGKDSAGDPVWFTVQGVLVYADGQHRGAWDISGAGSVAAIEPGHPVSRGSGCDIASGALLRGIMDRTDWSPAEEVQRAIEVTSRLELHVGGRTEVRSFPRNDGN